MIDPVARAVAFAYEFTKNHVLSSTPWHGVGDLPRKLEGGYPYVGVNIPTLLGQMTDPSSPAIFGTVLQWGKKDRRVKKGSKGLGFVYMRAHKKNAKNESELKEIGEDLEVNESGQYLKSCASFATFSESQTDDHDSESHHPILETLKRLQMDDEALIACGTRALEAGERYMDAWALTASASIRPMSEGERCLIVYLAADLVVGYNAGSMAVAGSLGIGYPLIAKEAAQRLEGRAIMRPWGIACDILRQLSPVFDANVVAGLEAAKVRQDDYKKKKVVAPVRDKGIAVETVSVDLEDESVSGNDEVVFPIVTQETVAIIEAAIENQSLRIITEPVILPELEAVDFNSNW